METDRNLLFGVLALQADLIDTRQFIEACTLWTARKDVFLADLLMERGWIVAEDRSHIEYLLERKLQKHSGDPRASLAAIDDNIKRSLAALGDAEIHQSLASLSPSDGTGQDGTVDFFPEAQQRYSLVRLHASGGIGRIWLARDSYLQRDVALKELRPERAEDSTLWARFLNEAQITGQLEHPGIVPVYELARRPDSKQPFYTMRFVRGRTLSEAVAAFHAKRTAGEYDSFELLTLLNAFVAVCNTIAYSHSRGVLHRDLKGHNVVLGDFGEVVVLDWGLAKRVDHNEADESSTDVGPLPSSRPDLTLHGQALGTPAYMAPEQAAGRLDEIDCRTDVYGLGAMLYEILTGQPPFSDADTRKLLRKVIEDQPAAPRDLVPEAPPALEAVCLRAIAKNPDHRYASASEIAVEVQGWQETQRRQAEEALRQSEALYHSLVETLPLQIWRKDRHSRFTFGNQRFCEAIGLSLAELVGKTDFDFFPAHLAQKYVADDATVLATGKTLELTEDHVTPKGAQLHVQVVKVPLFDLHGETVGIQGIFWDVTERQRLQEALRQSEALYHSLVETLPLCVWRKDPDGRFTFGSPRFCTQVFGRPESEIIGKTDYDFHFSKETADQYRSNDAVVLSTGKVLETNEIRVTPEGEQRMIQVIKAPVFGANGDVTGTQGIFWDVTDLKRLEEALRQTNIELAKTRDELQEARDSRLC